MKVSIASMLAALAAMPALTAATFYGVTADNQFVSFDSATPGSYLSSVAITGLVGTDGTTPDPFASIVNLSYHHSQGQFYGIDTNANIYRLGLNGSTTLLSNTFSPSGFNAGFNFDPLSGNFTFASDAAENFNITTSGSFTDNGSLVYGSGDANELTIPSIFGVAYDPDFGTAFFVDAATGTLSVSYDINVSELFTIGSLGIDVTSFGDLISDFDGNLYASLSEDGIASGFYAIDSLSGEASLIGAFSSGMNTIAIPEPSTALLGGLGLLGLLRRRRA